MICRSNEPLVWVAVTHSGTCFQVTTNWRVGALPIVAKLMLHRNILKNFSKLPTKVQKRVSELIKEFEEDPSAPAIGLHALKETMLDSKVRGVKKFPDGYRAIVIAPEKGDNYLLVHIDTHDEAYAWARNKRFEVHGMTGVFQVFDAEEIQAVAVDQKPSPTRNDYPLGALSDDDLFAAGVPRPLIPSVKAIIPCVVRNEVLA